MTNSLEEFPWIRTEYQHGWVKIIRRLADNQEAQAVISYREERINRPGCSEDIPPNRWRTPRAKALVQVKIAQAKKSLEYYA